MQATSFAQPVRQVRSQARLPRSSLRCVALEQPVPSGAAAQQGPQLPTWVKRVAATVVLVPTVALGMYGGNSAYAWGKAKKVKEVAPTVTVAEKKEENTLAAVWAKPEAKAAAGAAAALLLFSLVKGSSSESSTSSSSAASSSNGSNGSAAAVKNDAPISTEEAKDIINTVIMQEFYRVSDSSQDSVAALNDRTAGVFNRIMKQHTAMRKNKSLLSKHASIAKLLDTVMEAGVGKDVPVWSLMYDKQAILQRAEGGLKDFLEDIKQPYPDLHTVLTATSPDFAVATLCAVGAWALHLDVKANA